VVIGTALAAKADFIVTGDHGLLSVGEYEGVRIVSVKEALQILASG
jgi:predicted nucleic acid-binding protein